MAKTTVAEVLELGERAARAEALRRTHPLVPAGAAAIDAAKVDGDAAKAATDAFEEGKHDMTWLGWVLFRAWMSLLDLVGFLSGVSIFYLLTGHLGVMRAYQARAGAASFAYFCWQAAIILLAIGYVMELTNSLEAIDIVNTVVSRMEASNALLDSLGLQPGTNLSYLLDGNSTLSTLDVSTFRFSEDDISNHGGLKQLVSAGKAFPHLILWGVFAAVYGKQILDLCTQVAEAVNYPKLHGRRLAWVLENPVVNWCSLSPFLDGTFGPNLMTLKAYPLAKPWLLLSHATMVMLIAWSATTNSEARVKVLLALRLVAVLQLVCKNAYDLQRLMFTAFTELAAV